MHAHTCEIQWYPNPNMFQTYIASALPLYVSYPVSPSLSVPPCLSLSISHTHPLSYTHHCHTPSLSLSSLSHTLSLTPFLTHTLSHTPSLTHTLYLTPITLSHSLSKTITLPGNKSSWKPTFVTWLPGMS